MANVLNGTTTDPIRAAASIRDHEVRAIRVEQTDVRALAGAECDQAAGEFSRPAICFGVAEPVAVAYQQRVRAP